MKRTRLSSLWLCGWLISALLPAAEPKKDGTEPDYAAELPRIAPKSPEESLKAMRLRAGFHAEIVATEPLIRSPMAMDFDEFGRAFVVELPEYNQYASAKPHGKSAIKRLEDTDGDGQFDKATVYVDDLDYPTAVACWDGGILVGVAPEILFCKDSDGDGKADVRQTLFTGFGQDKGGEGMLNLVVANAAASSDLGRDAVLAAEVDRRLPGCRRNSNCLASRPRFRSRRATAKARRRRHSLAGNKTLRRRDTGSAARRGGRVSGVARPERRH